MSDNFFDNESDDPPASNVLELSVSEISGKLKRMVEDNFGQVRVRGEIGRVSRPASGHIYLDLKDERAVLAGVIWKGNAGRLKHPPEEGMEVIASGKLTTFPGSSKYQIIIDKIEPAGAGALMALLEERKKKLEAEGLFSLERKQLLPHLPTVVGVVTSPSGAVIRDILHRLNDRFPLHVLVWPVRVQGETSASEIAAAISGFNAFEEDGKIPRPDVLIIARGGGSIEDLWSFNEEAVVRAAADSLIPLISAVGHETDWTLVDHAADVRAPTPTGAAEMTVPVKAELEANIATLSARLKSGLSRNIVSAKSNLKAAMRGLPTHDSLFAIKSQRFDRAASALGRGLIAATQQKRIEFQTTHGRLNPNLLRAPIDKQRQRLEFRIGAFLSAKDNFLRQNIGRLDQASRLLGSFSYAKTLDRGFVVVRNSEGEVVSQSVMTEPGKVYELQFADDRIDVERITAPGTKTLQKPNKPPKKQSKASTEQGNLFGE